MSNAIQKITNMRRMKNRGILRATTMIEARRAKIMKRYTGKTLKPNPVRVFPYAMMTLRWKRTSGPK